MAPPPGTRAMGAHAHGHEMSAKEMYLEHTAKRHPFHVLPHSPWPLIASMGTFVSCLGETALSVYVVAGGLYRVD